MTTEDQPRRLRLRRKSSETVALRPEGVRPPVSERLRAARQAKGLDLFRIERDTKIRTRFLEAIEDGRYDDLPGELYARGFLRNYASYLGLDPATIEAQWRAEIGQPEPPPPGPLIKPTPRAVIPQPMPESLAPPPAKKAAKKRSAAQAAAEEAATEGRKSVSVHVGLPKWHLPAVRRPALKRPALRMPKPHMPSLRLPRPATEGADAVAAVAAVAAVPAAAPPVKRPEPVPVPRRSFLLQPAHIVLLAMGGVVLAVTAFFGIQVTRILDYPTVTVTAPSKAVTTLAPGTAQYELAGTATPGVIIRISWDERDPNTVMADSMGRWTFKTPLHSGLNQFDISARNEQTNHDSAVVRIILDVPIPTASPTPRLLVVDAPTDGQMFQSGDVAIKGNTVGVASITITPAYVGPPPAPGSTPRPSATPAAPTPVPTLMPLATPTPLGSGSPTPRPTATRTPNPSATAGPQAVNVIPTIDGKFSTVMHLTPGVWTLTVVGFDTDGKSTTPVVVKVTVAAPTLRVVIEVKGGSAWLNIWKDGVLLPGYAKEFPNGTRITILANESVWIRTGSAVKTYVTVNGRALGPLGGARSGSWRITASGPPVPSQDY